MDGAGNREKNHGCEWEMATSKGAAMGMPNHKGCQPLPTRGGNQTTTTPNNGGLLLEIEQLLYQQKKNGNKEEYQEAAAVPRRTSERVC